MSNVRTFIAIELAGTVKKRADAIIKRLQAVPAKVAWVRPQNMHLTLKFLGDVPDRELNDVCRAVQGAVAVVEPFEIVFRGCGAFPNPAHPRTIWLGVDQGHAEVTGLHASVDSALKELRFPKETRRFQPHLTLGRVHEPSGARLDELSQLIAQFRDYDGDLTVVDEVVVMASFLDRGSTSYEPLGHCELGKGERRMGNGARGMGIGDRESDPDVPRDPRSS